MSTWQVFPAAGSASAAPAHLAARTPQDDDSCGGTDSASLRPPAQPDLQWDAWLRAFPKAHVYQSSAWAHYKRRSGWQSIRMLLPDADGTPRAMLQGMVKHVPLLGSFLWAPGAPVWRSAPTAGDAATLAAALATLAGVRYARLLDFSSASPAYAGALRRPQVVNSSGASLWLDILAPRETWLAASTGKHRYYVRRALREPIEWRTGNDTAQIAALAALTGELRQLKQTGHQPGLAELQAQSAALGPAVLTLVGYVDGLPVSGCQVLRWEKMAIYATAATNPAGRALSAAYAMIAELREVLRAQGVVTLDFGGLDPGNPAARGVDHFKRGFGGQAVTYAGDWEWAASPWSRALGNLVVRLRRGRST